MRTRLERAPYDRLLDLREETGLAPHFKRALVQAAAWAIHFGQRANWHRTDYGALVAPDSPPSPEDEIAATLAACRTTRFSQLYIELLLRWAWAPRERREAVGLRPPYDPLLPILDVAGHINAEHGFMGPGMASISINTPESHLSDDLSDLSRAVDEALQSLP